MSKLITFHSFIIPLITTLISLIPFPATASVPAIIAFGDSSVDTGNNNHLETVLKSNFRPYGRDFEGGRPTGRFCNGRVPPDFISELFGVKRIVPAYLDGMYGIQDFATGVVFASAGTGYDNLTSSVLNVIPFLKEIEYYKEYQTKLREYLGEEKANETISEALYLISIGTNDFLENYYLLPMTRSHYTLQDFEDHLIEIAYSFVRTIYGLGARKISIGGLPPMGCLPLERTTNLFAVSHCNEEYNAVALEFNGKLKTLVSQLNVDLDGIKVVFSNPYGMLMSMINQPSLYGFEVTTKACCGTGLTEMGYLCNLDNSLSCSNANNYVFWDSFHPTEKANQLISAHVFNKVLRKFL